MQFVESFISNFFSDPSIITLEENAQDFRYELTATKFSFNELVEAQSALNFLQNNDQLSFTITFGNADPISFYSTNIDFADFKSRLEAEYIHQEGESIAAIFTIEKKQVFGSITIYDLDTFTNTISRLSIAQAFVIFNKVLSGLNFVNFNVFNLDYGFNTKSIFFTPTGLAPVTNAFLERSKRLESLRTASYFTNILEHSLIPDDFKIEIENTKYLKLCSLFNQYAGILSVIYLFDITTVKGNILEFKINGYKSIKGSVEVHAHLIPGTNQYFDIYSWVYSGGNLNDKIGLARNIISLHFIKSGELGLKGSPYQSIQSGYKVYEKQNIKQYIEIRNKVSDQLLEFNNRANKVIESFASGFQKSALALISFYISAIALKVLGKGDFVNIFTLDATLLSIAFIAGSFIYYRVSKWEVKEQRKRFVDSYNNLKERYTDLLEGDDIQRIVNNDKEFNSDLAFIDSKLKNYTNMWKWFLAILLIITLILFLVYNLPLLLNKTSGLLNTILLSLLTVGTYLFVQLIDIPSICDPFPLSGKFF